MYVHLIFALRSLISEHRTPVVDAGDRLAHALNVAELDEYVEALTVAIVATLGDGYNRAAVREVILEPLLLVSLLHIAQIHPARGRAFALSRRLHLLLCNKLQMIPWLETLLRALLCFTHTFDLL